MDVIRAFLCVCASRLAAENTGINGVQAGLSNSASSLHAFMPSISGTFRIPEYLAPRLNPHMPPSHLSILPF